MEKPTLENLEKRIKRLEQIINGPQKQRIRIRLSGDEDPVGIIQKVVCQIWGITLERLLSKSREGSVADARKAAMLLVYNYGLGSTKEVAARFNREDHSTVSFAMRSAKNHLENKDSGFTERYEKAKGILELRFETKSKIDYQI
jgi:chromosomal replication initiation ATPase DnaA